MDANVFSCPCCTRTFETENEFEAFRKQLKILASERSPLVQIDERRKESKSKYMKWKNIVTEHYEEILEYCRIGNEIKSLEMNMSALDDRLCESLRQLDDAKQEASDLESQVASLRDFHDSVKNWSETAGRITEKRMQISQKEEQLTMGTGVDTKGRSLQTVESEINELIEKREAYATKVSLSTYENIVLLSRDLTGSIINNK